MTDPDKTEKVLMDLREVVSEARACLKDFKIVQREFKKEVEDYIINWDKKLDKEFGAIVVKKLNALDEGVEIATSKVFERFDKLTAMLMGEDRYDPSIEEMIRVREYQKRKRI